MKTSVVMNRKMAIGSHSVEQRTKDGYFNANILLNSWNSIKNNPNRAMTRFLESPKTLDFIDTIEQDSPIAEMQDGGFKAVIIKKGRNTKKGKTKDATWMHPYLFIDFAMWINPKFKLEVIKFVYDQLIEQRHLAGDNYNALTASAAKLKGVDYPTLAKALNWLVFGKHAKGLRQNASQEQLKELADIQRQLAFSIDMGMIKDFDGLMKILRKMWNQKFNQIAA